MSMLEKGTGAIEEHRAAGWVLQMLSAIAYCHERRVCHRDLKPENFCFQSLAADAPLKLLDFGCSKQLDTAASTMTKKCGTWDYMAPEQIPSIDPQTGQRSRYGLGVDLWSIGVIAYVLLGMEFPFGWCADAERDAQADFTQRTIVTNILRGEYRPMEPHVDRELRWGKDETRMHGEAWTSVSAVAKDFVRRLLVVDPAQRMTAKEALKHPWLSAAHRDVLRGLERPAASRSAAAMLTFRRRTPMQKAAMHAIALQLSADELEELRKTFAAIDTDCDGTLSRAEVRAAFARLGVEGATTPRASLASGAFVAAGPSPINRMFSELGDDEGLRGGGGGDDDDAPHIGWHSFVAAALEQRHLEDADNVAAAFNALDVDHTGSISVHDLATVFGGGGGAGEGRSGEGEGGAPPLDAAALSALLKEVDVDGSGDITRRDFARIVRARARSVSAHSRTSSRDHSPLSPARLALRRARSGGRSGSGSDLDSPARTPRRSSLIPPRRLAKIAETMLIPDGNVASCYVDSSGEVAVGGGGVPPVVARNARACAAALVRLPPPRDGRPSLTLCWNPPPCDELYLRRDWRFSHYEVVWRIHGTHEYRFTNVLDAPGTRRGAPHDPSSLWARVTLRPGEAESGVIALDACVRCVSADRDAAGVETRSMCTPLSTHYFDAAPTTPPIAPTSEYGRSGGGGGGGGGGERGGSYGGDYGGGATVLPRGARARSRSAALDSDFDTSGGGGGGAYAGRGKHRRQRSSRTGTALLRETLLSGSTTLDEETAKALSPRGDGVGLLPRVGQIVRCESDGEVGRCAWVGTVRARTGIWIGLRLDNPVGRHDGVFGRDAETGNALRLFTCERNRGRFVRPSGVTIVRELYY